MSKSTNAQFNIEPLVIEIEKVIKNGLITILNNYISRYELLEKTHTQIMRLPSVMSELNQEFDINNNVQELVKNEISLLENKICTIENKFDTITPLINKMLDKLEKTNEEVQELKDEMVNCKKSYINKPSIVATCENENIKFEINEGIEKQIKTENNEVEVVERVVVKEEPIIIEENDEDDTESVSLVENKIVNLEEEEIPEIEKEPPVLEEEEVEEEEDVEEEEEENVEEEEEDVEEEENVEEEEENVEEEEDVEEEENVEEEEEDVEEEDVKTQEEEVETEASEEEEEELEIITIDDIDYCTNDAENGFIWEINDDGEPGDKIGYFKEEEPFFYADVNK
jgi:hypothetical protein